MVRAGAVLFGVFDKSCGVCRFVSETIIRKHDAKWCQERQEQVLKLVSAIQPPSAVGGDGNRAVQQGIICI
jgi:hypothetical protein